MKLRKLRLSGITRFHEPIEVDFEALGEGLVSIAGPNGEGKSTLLEGPFAALYGEFPGYPGSLYGSANGRDARIEVELSNGSRDYRALMAVDAVGQRTEAFLSNGDGTPLTDGKVRTYLAKVEEVFGSARMTLACALKSRRRRGSFLTASKAERKDLVCEALMLEHLQALSEAARARAKAGESQLERLRGQLSEAEADLARLGPGVDIDALRARRAKLTEDLAQQQAEIEGARTREATVRAARAAADEQVKARSRIASALAEVAERQRSLHQQREGLGAEKVALEGRIAKARETAEADAARAPEYREAAEELAAARARRDEQRQRLASADVDVSAARRNLTALQESQATAGRIRQQVGAAIARRDEARALAAKVQDYQAAVREVESLRERRAGYAAALDFQERAVRLASERLAAKQREVAPLGAARAGLTAAQQQAELLDAVPCTKTDEWIDADVLLDPTLGSEVDLAGTCPLLASARAARDKVAEYQAAVATLELAEAEVPGLEAALTNAEQQIAGTRQEIKAVDEALEWRHGEVADLAGAPEAAARVEREQAEIARLSDELAEVSGAESLIPPAQANLVAAEALQVATAAALSDVETEIAELEPLAARLPVAEAATQRLAELTAELAAGLEALDRRRSDLAEEAERLSARRVALDGELAETPEADVAGLDRQLVDLAERLRRGRVMVDELQARLTAAAEETTRAEEAEKRRSELAARVETSRETSDALARDLGEWAVLERALGRDGVQALEIAAAGPELTELTNDLLHSCFGERFDVKFITQAPKADGASLKEVFDVSVVDHARGREASADRYSGGEETILDEAISLALAVYVSRHSEHTYRTIWRDEATGLLDAQNAQRYIAMLRRARALAGASQIVFVAQQSEVYEQADAVLWVQDGRVEVRAS